MSIITDIKESKIGQFCLKNEQKIILAIGIVLIAAASFEAGYLHGQENKHESVVVSKITGDECAKKENTQSATTPNTGSSQNSSAKAETQIPTENKNCAFVASKNSNKFHLPTCQFAQKIKPENRICFSSQEDAISRGYQGAKCCIK